MFLCFFVNRRESNIKNIYLSLTIDNSDLFAFLMLALFLIGVNSLSSSAHNNIHLTISFIYIYTFKPTGYALVKWLNYRCAIRQNLSLL